MYETQALKKECFCLYLKKSLKRFFTITLIHLNFARKENNDVTSRNDFCAWNAPA